MVDGRTAWLQASDWNWLVLPVTLASTDDVFAVQADVFIPPYATFSEHADIFMFDNITDPLGNWGAHGLAAGIVATGTTTDDVEWWFYPETVLTYNSTAAITFTTGQWHTLRVEGVRSLCFFQTLLDGVPVGNLDIACDTSGTQIGLLGEMVANPTPFAVNIAWSNLTISAGSAGCAPWE